MVNCYVWFQQTINFVHGMLFHEFTCSECDISHFGPLTQYWFVLATLCRRFGKLNTANDKMLAPFELALEKCNQCCYNSTISGFQKTFVNYNTPLLYCFDYLTQKTKDNFILGLKIQRTLNVGTVDFEISSTQRNLLENICTVTINNMLVW